MDLDEADGDKSPSLHRPVSAFILFCQRHRQIVREKHPSIENKAVTKILGEWWSNLTDKEKSPYTSLAHQYSEAFMKANPDFRWHKMPPGSVESLPPSNAKPSTPSPANGMTCTAVPSLLDSASAPAPKPFKKRYLASQQANSEIAANSPLSSAGVSPEAARACEALIELSRNESCTSRSSDGSDRRSSPSDTPPLQTLREAVWSKVAGTLLKQEEDKLMVPPKDCPMNLTNQCTIRGQQIIEHIIENILSIPMNGPLDPTSEPLTFSVNNNQERESALSSANHSCLPISLPNGDVGDSIKTAIFESLKNDLLKGKSTPLLPVNNSRPPPISSSQKTASSSSSPTVSPSSGPRQKVATTSRKQEASSAVSTSSSGQDVLRLLGTGQLPINVGNSAITITKTPRVNMSTTTKTHSTTTITTTASSSPVSLSLTRTDPSKGFPAPFNAINGGVPVLLAPQTVSGLVLSSPGSLVLSGLPGRQPAGDCVLLSPVQPVGNQPMIHTNSPHLLLAGTKLVLASSPSQHSPPSTTTAAAATITKATSPPETYSPSRVEATKRPAADSIGEERRSSRTGRGRRYQEFIEDISSNKKKRRSHRSGEETSEPEADMDALASKEEVTNNSSSSQQHIHWKKMRTASLGSKDNTQQGGGNAKQPPLANQETPTANPQFDLDAKMEKIEPLKYPDNLSASPRTRTSSSSTTSASKPSSGRSSRQQERSLQQPNKAFDSKLLSHNKKSR